MNYQMNDLKSVFSAYNPKTGKNEPPILLKDKKKIEEEGSKNNEKSTE